MLVERIEHFATNPEWRRAYGEIQDMEAQWVKQGIIVQKFWMHIDQDEQLKRFQDRENDPNKTWKITPDDWRNRSKWDAYVDAVNEMIYRTDTPEAPWTVVEANNKLYARIKGVGNGDCPDWKRLWPRRDKRRKFLWNPVVLDGIFWLFVYKRQKKQYNGSY